MFKVKNIILKNRQIIGAMIACHVTATEDSILAVVTQLVDHLLDHLEQPIKHREHKESIWVSIQTFHSNVLIAKKK